MSQKIRQIILITRHTLVVSFLDCLILLKKNFQKVLVLCPVNHLNQLAA